MSFSLFRRALASRRDSAGRPARRRILPTLERLEDRTVPTVVNPTVHLLLNPGALVPAGSAGQPGGFSPAQIRHAYGFDQIAFSNGTVVGDGTGQTIAVVDAYDQPNIASDLSTFDSMYGIAGPPKFTKVNQSGGTSYPTADTNWGLEISLDVEWAHAIAPGANILLVEATSSGFSDLITAVNYARNQAGVSVMSMSWGAGEYSGETAYDSYFTTPSGHNGVTFVASTGDSGSAGAPESPSVSPNVLAVGGTQLTTDGTGNYLGETGWSGSGGGVSVYESQPGYQKGVVTQTNTMRAVPDVAYNGSSGSPFAIYDTSGYGGWLQVYGTSAGAPQWSALIAIADQGRALAGKGTLDGASQTLPTLYQLSSSDFHDITSGSNGAYSAGPGYDLVTGRGTPVANLVVADLVGTASSSTNQAPTVATPASATPNQVTGTTTNLSVLGADDGGAANLTYTWSVALAPAGSTTRFSANGTNAAQNATATFSMAGTYTFTATITDAGGLTATSSVTVTVSQTLTSAAVTPGSTSVADGGTQQFTASAKDQFGAAMSTQPAWSWSVVGMGTISGGGMYSAPNSGAGTDTVQASGGGMSATALVTVNSPPAAPSNLTATVVSAKQINLSWTDNSGNETGFVIQRSTNGSNWSQLATVGANVTSYSDTTVNKRHTYYYRVYAYNSFGNSAYSSTSKGVTPADNVVRPRAMLLGQTAAATTSWPTAPASTGAMGNAGSDKGGVLYVSSGQNVAGSSAAAAANADAWMALHHPPIPSDAFWLLWSEDLTQDVFRPWAS